VATYDALSRNEEGQEPGIVNPDNSARTSSSAVMAIVWVSLTALLLLSLLSAIKEGNVAHAHRFTANPSITIHKKGRTFFGRVKSRHPTCKMHRRVTLVRARRVLSDIIVARDSTNEFGKWRIKRPRRPHGRFYAIIPKKVRTSYGHSHTCRYDRSRTIDIA
jgi:hypothetical protein